MIVVLPLPGDSPLPPSIPIFSPQSGECHAGHSSRRTQWAHECKVMVNLKALCGGTLVLMLKILNHHFPPGSIFIFQIPSFNFHPQELMTMVIFLLETLLLGPTGGALWAVAIWGVIRNAEDLSWVQKDHRARGVCCTLDNSMPQPSP